MVWFTSSKKVGISGGLLKLSQSYLDNPANRFQIVLLVGQSYEWQAVRASAPPV